MSQETVNIKMSLDIEVEVKGTYVSAKTGERRTVNGDGWPDEPSEFKVEQVLFNGTDITAALQADNYDWASLQEECITEIENN
jgi:hypothetical protein